MGVRRIPVDRRPGTRGQDKPYLAFFGNQRGWGNTIAGMHTSLGYFLSIVWFILWVVAIFDCAKSDHPNKIGWIVVIILLPFLGSILYFIFGRRNTRA